jgi:putative SOS response-associated peptidase YedK
VRDEGVVYRPRYNLAPGDQHWIVRRGGAGRLLVPARWGFPTATSRLLINARVETAARVPTFRDAFRTRRCLVPADGFYEWRRQDGRRLPIWYHHADDRLLLMAGLFTSTLGPGVPRPAFTILTMPANDVVAPTHDRMPVVLSPDAARAWLEDPRFDPSAPAAWGGFGHDLLATPVSTRVNAASYDGPECLAPPQPDDGAPAPVADRQLRLVE